MSLNFKDIFQHFFVNGDTFKPVPGGKLDKLFSGICSAVDNLVAEAKKVSAVRDPALTDMLNDLEKDYGLISDSNLTEEERRKYLSVFAFKKNGTGVPDDLNGFPAFLQKRLRSAGFDELSVYENSPEVNPNDILSYDHRLYLADSNAYVGDPDALIGRSFGELFIDGVNLYDIPAEERYNYVFFVGGESFGWNILADYNMEDPSTNHWTPNSGTILSKDTSKFGSKNQSLKVQDSFNTEEQEPFVFPSCAPVSSFRFYDLDADLGLTDPDYYDVKEIEFNGSFEDDLTGWTSVGSVTTEIGTATPDPVDGTKYLKIGGTPDDDYIKTGDILTVGKTYRLTGYAMSGFYNEIVPQWYRGAIKCGTSQVVKSTGNNYTEFDEFDVIFTAEDTFLSIGTYGSYYYATIYSNRNPKFDGLVLIELGEKTKNHIIDIAPINLIFDPTLDKNNIDNWQAGNSAALSKDSGSYRGSYCLKVLYNGTSNPYAYNKPYDRKRLRKGYRYRVSGYYKTDGSCSAVVKLTNYLDDITLSSSGSDTWVNFSTTFVCACSDQILAFGCDAIASGEHVFYDQLSITPLRSDYTEYTRKDYNMISDGDCQETVGQKGIGVHWLTLNNATLTKEGIGSSDIVLKVEHSGTGNPGAYQYCTVLDRRYRMTCKIFASETGNVVSILSHSSTIIYQYEKQESDLFHDIEIEFESAGDHIRFILSGDTGDYMLINNVNLYELGPRNNSGENTIEKIGRTIIFEDDELCEVYNISESDIVDRFTITGWIKPYANYEFFTNSYFSISVSAGKLSIDGISSIDDLAIGEWNYFALSFDTDRTEDSIMYLNGEKQSISGSLSIPTVYRSATVQDVQIQSISFYGFAMNDEEIIQDYKNGMSVFFGGLVKHEKAKGIANVESDIVIDNTKLRQQVVLNAADYLQGYGGINDLLIAGSGDDPELSFLDYSNNKAIQFLNGKYYEAVDSDYLDFSETDSNCFVFRFICENEDGDVFTKYQDSGNYWKVDISSGSVYFRINTSSGGEIEFHSSAIADESLFCDVLVNLETGTYAIYVNGKNVEVTGDTITNLHNVSNTGKFTIGNGSESLISFVSVFSGVDIF